MPRHPATSVLAAILNARWAIQPDWLEFIIARVQREDFTLTEEMQKQVEAVQARKGAIAPNTKFSEVHGSVGVLKVHGPIVRYADDFEDISALTSVERIAYDANFLANNSAIKTIVLDVASPGGILDGVVELSHMLAKIDASKKPVFTYGSGSVASAAYMIGSAGRERVTSKTSPWGSIGVVAVIRNPQKKDQIEFVSNQSPYKRPDLETPEGQAVIQAEVDYLAEVFIEEVAALVGVSTDKVKADFGQGGVLYGKAAVDAGLADRVGSLEELISELNDADISSVKRRKTFKAEGEPASVVAESDIEETAMPDDKKTAADQPWYRKVLAALSPDERKDALASLATDSATTPPTQPVPGAQATPALPAALQSAAAGANVDASVIEAKGGQFLAEANSFYLEFRGSKVAVAEELTVKRQYYRAAMDDFLTPVPNGEQSRVAVLRASIEARPKRTDFTADNLPGGEGKKFQTHPAARTGTEGVTGDEASPDRLRALLGMSELGRKSLRALEQQEQQ